ncbi:uncharacterized protein LOC110423964 isoform X2 [Herrania umbratica]|uniref:Uncharacterized protein LOC110423964 isoform X2 n=1 Tax=Herrania umbratica TaxID=108875 RepID=A0A6J1B4V3_9ROSI|nr:uncharacterized protein LOC110423964 isoform X2 [Herrania umbratica]
MVEVRHNRQPFPVRWLLGNKGNEVTKNLKRERERVGEKRCLTCYRTCTQGGPSIKPSSPRKNVLSSSVSAMIGTTPACRNSCGCRIAKRREHSSKGVG